MMKYLVLVLVLVTLVSSLNLKETHLIDQEAYLEKLQQMQGDFKETVNDLSLSTEAKKKQLDAYQTLAQKISALEGAIMQEGQMLESASIALIPDLNLSSKACKNLTDDQKKQVVKSVDDALKNYDQLTPKVDKLDSNQRSFAVKTYLKNSKEYLNAIKETVYANCSTDLLLTPSLFQTNLNSPNWILGDQTMADVVQQYTERAKTFKNITNCPLDKPFFDGQECMNCEAGEYYTLDLQECMKCDDKSEFSKTLHNCVPKGSPTETSPTEVDPDVSDLNTSFLLPPSKSNQASLDRIIFAPGKSITDYRLKENEVECPLDTPFFNGEKCIPCDEKMFFDDNSKACKECTTFDKLAHQCE